MENMAPRLPLRRNKIYSSKLQNATRTIQTHNSTFQEHLYPWNSGNVTHPYLHRNQSNLHRWRPVVNGSHRFLKRPNNMTYLLKQSEKYNSLYLKNTRNSLNPNLRNYNVTDYVRWNSTNNYKFRNQPLRSTRLHGVPHKIQDQPVAQIRKGGNGNSLVNQR